jgi:hypothetical protein
MRTRFVARPLVRGSTPDRIDHLKRPRSVSVIDQAVYVEDRVIARRDLVAGYVVPKPPAVWVRARDPQNSMSLAVENVAEGRQLLRALGFDAEDHTVAFRIESPWSHLSVAVFEASVLVALLVHPALLILGALAFMFVRRDRVLTVGNDGLRVPRFFGERFVPFASVADVEPLPRGARIVHADGKGMGLTMVDARDGFFERVAEAHAAWRRSAHEEITRPLVASGDRSGRARVAEMRALLQEGPLYRTVPVTEETLWHVVEDPTSPAAARAGAAAALTTAMDEQGRARLQRAASATASGELAHAFTRAADPATDEDDLAEAVEACIGSRAEIA